MTKIKILTSLTLSRMPSNPFLYSGAGLVIQEGLWTKSRKTSNMTLSHARTRIESFVCSETGLFRVCLPETRQ